MKFSISNCGFLADAFGGMAALPPGFCKPYCQGLHIMALGWEAKVPELLKLAGI